MAINYDVYGQPETWQNCFYAGGSTAAWTTLLNGEKAKVPTWNETHPDVTSYATSQLRYGVADGKIQERVPIDNSIAAIGQGSSSPFRKWFVYANIADDEHPNGQVRNIGQAYTGTNFNDDATPINTFWFEANNPTASAIYGNAAFSGGLIPLATIDRRIWSPSGENAEGTDRQNGNYYIAPFMSYGTRSFCLQIMVFDAGEYNAEYTPGSQAPSGQWRTLEQWKNNYPTHAITAAWFRIRSLSAYNTTTGVMGYYAQNYGSSEYRKISSGILDTIKFELDEGTAVPELTDYALFGASYNNELGVRVFTPHSDLYKWQNNLQNILLYPTEISGYIKSNGSVIVPYVPYSDEFYEYLMRACACFGMPFTPAKSTGVNAGDCQFNQDFTDTDLCLPVIDDNGIANGDYTRGSGNLDNDFIDLSDIRDKGYDPLIPPTPIDPNTYSDTTNWNTVNFQNTFCKRYELTAAQVGQLAAELWAAQASKPADIDYHNFAIDEYLTNNPIDTIVSLKYFPCDVETAANPAIVHLGKYQTQIAANGISHTVKVIDFDPIDVFPHFGDYRDYEPYTTLQMYIPFCGTVSIPTAEAMGKYVSVKLCIDINTGACVGFVIVSNSGSGGICVATATGTASIDIPVSGLQSANLSQAIFNATAQWTQTQISNAKISSGLLSHAGGLLGNISKGISKQGGLSPTSILGALKGGPVGSVGLLDRLDPVKAYWSGYESEIESSKADYNLTHVEIPMRLIGSTSPALSSVIESSCRLIIYRPITDEGALSHYADTVGFATVSSGTVSQFTGYTEGTIDVSGINASASEKSEIQRLFASGVYL